MTWHDLLDIGPAAAATVASVVAYTAAVAARRAANGATATATTLLSALTLRPRPARPETPPTRPVWPRIMPPQPADDDEVWSTPIPAVLYDYYTGPGRNLTGFRWRGQQTAGPYPYTLRAIDVATGRRFDATGIVRGSVVFETSATLRPAAGPRPAWDTEATQPLPIVPRPRKGEA